MVAKSVSVLISARDVANFGTSDERLTSGKWRIALVGTTHRDSNAIDESNAAVILEALAKLDPESRYHDTLECSHWAVGTITHVIVDASACALVECLEAFAASLEDYAILDEDHESQLECERHDDGRCDEHCTLCEYLREDHRDGRCVRAECTHCEDEHQRGKCREECTHCAEESSDDE